MRKAKPTRSRTAMTTKGRYVVTRLGGSMNELYAPGDAADRASSIARFAAKNRAQIRSSNLALSAHWGWRHGVERIIAAVAT